MKGIGRRFVDWIDRQTIGQCILWGACTGFTAAVITILARR